MSAFATTAIAARAHPLLDPHTSAELDLDQVRNLVDDLIESHGDWLPELT